MKESLDKPHYNEPLEYSRNRKQSELRNLTEKKNPLKETLIGLQLSLKNTSNNFESNRYPYIPICKISGKWGDLSLVDYQYTYIAWCKAFQPG